MPGSSIYICDQCADARDGNRKNAGRRGRLRAQERAGLSVCGHAPRAPGNEGMEDAPQTGSGISDNAPRNAPAADLLVLQKNPEPAEPLAIVGDVFPGEPEHPFHSWSLPGLLPKILFRRKKIAAREHESLAGHRPPREPAGGPGSLEIEAASDAVDIQDFTGEK